MASIRDYDTLLAEKPSYSPPYIHKTGDGQRVAFQTWNWEGERYRLVQYIIEDEGALQVSKFVCEYRAVLREDSLGRPGADGGWRGDRGSPGPDAPMAPRHVKLCRKRTAPATRRTQPRDTDGGGAAGGGAFRSPRRSPPVTPKVDPGPCSARRMAQSPSALHPWPRPLPRAGPPASGRPRHSPEPPGIHRSGFLNTHPSPSLPATS